MTNRPPRLKPISLELEVRAWLEKIPEQDRPKAILRLLDVMSGLTAGIGKNLGRELNEYEIKDIENKLIELNDVINNLDLIKPTPTLTSKPPAPKPQSKPLPEWVVTRKRCLNDIRKTREHLIKKYPDAQKVPLCSKIEDFDNGDNQFTDWSWAAGGYLTLLNFESMPFLKNAYPSPSGFYQAEETLEDDNGASYGKGSIFTKEGTTEWGTFIKELCKLRIDPDYEPSPPTQSLYSVTPPSPIDPQ